LIVAGALCLLGNGRAATVKKLDESGMQRLAPQSVPGYRMIPGPEGLAYTYRMPQSTYDALKPFGIVARQFTNGNQTFDVVLVTSDSHESFHDPKICFSAQGWNFKSLSDDTVAVPGRGTIPMTVADMTGDHQEALAAYFYRGPAGFVSNPKVLQLDMFKEVLFGRKSIDSTFYRFMPSSANVSLDQLKSFIAAYMVSAERQSGGFY